MRTKFSLIAFLSIIMIIISGCSQNDSVEKEIDSGSDVVETLNVEKDAEVSDEKLFMEKYINTSERPIAFMIDNDDKNSRPHAGLDEAYLVYEIPVEGGSTRFLALFRGVNTEKIGPVRSSRHYFLDYVLENDAIYTHFGWSPKAMQDISSLGINKINGILGEDADVFWREEKYKGDWHSAFTSIEKVKEKASGKSYRVKTDHKNGMKYSETIYTPDEQSPANEVYLNYSARYKTAYIYNTETGMYEKSIDSQPHIMQNGNVFSVKNIIVELIYDTSLGDGTDRRDIKTTGTGKGYYITDGGYEEITWSKSSRSDNTIYTRTDGSELVLNPGKTIVNIVSPAIGVVFE